MLELEQGTQFLPSGSFVLMEKAGVKGQALGGVMSGLMRFLKTALS